jgi:putative salt-induced outer membrane protein
MRYTYAAALLLAALALSASHASAKDWKDSAELSIISANGNTKTQTISGKNSFTYDFSDKTKLEVEAGGHGARNEGKVVAEQYFAGEKVSHKISDLNYLFERYRWDRDVFAGFKHRHSFAAGIGRELWKTDKDLLVGEAAPGYVNEERVGDNTRSFASARLYAKYTREFSETSKFSQDAEYTQSLQNSDDSWINTETALIAAFNTTFSVKNSFVWKHVSRPSPGKRKDDTVIAVALIASF